jgi:hypothetical protein
MRQEKPSSAFDLYTYRSEQGRGQIPFDPLDASLMSLDGTSLPDNFYEEVILPIHIAPEVLLEECYLE